jgi:regulator of sigma E protease
MTLIGGPLFNLILGVILFTVIFMRLGVPDTKVVQVYSVTEGSPALAAGIVAGDQVLSINNQKIESTEQLSNLISELKGTEVTITLISSDGSQRTVSAIPRVDPPPNEGSLGITMANPYRKATLFESVPFALQSTGN